MWWTAGSFFGRCFQENHAGRAVPLGSSQSCGSQIAGTLAGVLCNDFSLTRVIECRCCIDHAKIKYLQASNLAQGAVWGMWFFFGHPERVQAYNVLHDPDQRRCYDRLQLDVCSTFRGSDTVLSCDRREWGTMVTRDKHAHICFGFWHASCYVRLKFQVWRFRK